MTDIFKKLMLRVAEFMEIILAIYLVVVLILVIGRTIVVETPMIFTEMTSIHHFLELSLTLAVAIEFVKMLCMHTPGTLIEVLLFAIARHMIVESPTPFQNLVIVLSIVALFAARKYLLTAHDQRGMNEHAHGTHHILKDLMKLREERKELKETVETARERKRLDKVGVFTYSREEDTPAYNMENQISEEVMQERYHDLMSVQSKISEEVNQSFEGKVIEVLVEGRDEEQPNIAVGRSYREAPEVDGQVYIEGDTTSKPGDVIKVKVLQGFTYDVVGEPVKE